MNRRILTGIVAAALTVLPAAAGTTDAILILDATLVAGTSVTVAAHLDASGNPQLRAYANENSATGIQPFHLANVAAVDIFAGGEPVLEGVRPTADRTHRRRRGTSVPGVGIGAAGSGEVAIDLGTVTVPADTLVLAYAIGPDEGAALPSVVVATVGVSATIADTARRTTAGPGAFFRLGTLSPGDVVEVVSGGGDVTVWGSRAASSDPRTTFPTTSCTHEPANRGWC